MTCVPNPADTSPAATAAADPLLEPPGVRDGSHGLRVRPGSTAANSVVTVLPTITAPASRRAETPAESRTDRHPLKSGEPCSVGMSAVSMMSLMPIGIPSIGESGLPARHRAVEASAAVRAAGILVLTNAWMVPSHSFMRARHRSRKSRGVSVPERNASCAAAYEEAVGFDMAFVSELGDAGMQKGAAPVANLRETAGDRRRHLARFHQLFAIPSRRLAHLGEVHAGR